MDYSSNQQTRTIKFIAGGVALFVLLILVIAFFPIVIIGTGERGVVFNNATGVEDRVLSEGTHVRIPFLQTVKKLSVQVQKDEVQAPAASKDLQTVNTKIVVNWHLDASRVHRIYQSVGDEKAVVDRILIPNTSEVVKAATAKYTAEELLTKRADLKLAIDEGLTARLKPYNIILDDVSITDIDFSPEFNRAIEAKAAAVQNAQKAQNDLARIKIEAEQKITTAQADAEAIRIQAEALAQNQSLVQWEAVKKWDGKMPHYNGGGVLPFLNIGQ